MRSWTTAPTLDEIDAIARGAMARLPDLFRRHIGDVVLRVEDFPTDEQLEAVGIDSPYELSGLYTGIAVGEKSVDHSGTMPDMVHLFRVPLLLEWAEEGETLEHLITHVIVHEIGHHFGLSDEAMHAIEEAAGSGN